MSAEPRPTISAWVCGECDYWQQYKGQGVHQTANPSDPRGPLAIHVLREVWFVPEAVRVVLAERVSTLITGIRDAQTELRKINDRPQGIADEPPGFHARRALTILSDALAGLAADPATQETPTTGDDRSAVAVEHRIEIVQKFWADGHTAECSCGWRSEEMASQAAAIEKGIAHASDTEPLATPDSAVAGSPVVSGEETPDA